MYLKKWDSAEQQVLQTDNISECTLIHGAKYGDMEKKLFEWFCHA
jgi:hypothetical protein